MFDVWCLMFGDLGLGFGVGCWSFDLSMGLVCLELRFGVGG